MLKYCVVLQKNLSEFNLSGLVLLFTLVFTPNHSSASTEIEGGSSAHQILPAEAETKQIQSHLRALKEAEKVIAQEVAQKEAIEKQRAAHQKQIQETRNRIKKLPEAARQEVLAQFAARLIAVLDQLETNSQASNQRTAYRTMPADVNEKLYQEGLEILEAVSPITNITRSTYLAVGVSSAVFSASIALAVWGASLPYRYDEMTAPFWVGAYTSPFIAAVTVRFLLGLKEEWSSNRINNKIWEPFWKEITQHYQAQMPKGSSKRMPWLMEKLLAAYRPDIKVRIAGAIAKAETKLKCQTLLTEAALTNELDEEYSNEDLDSAKKAKL